MWKFAEDDLHNRYYELWFHETDQAEVKRITVEEQQAVTDLDTQYRQNVKPTLLHASNIRKEILDNRRAFWDKGSRQDEEIGDFFNRITKDEDYTPVDLSKTADYMDKVRQRIVMTRP
jgi:hypothetical protein